MQIHKTHNDLQKDIKLIQSKHYKLKSYKLITKSQKVKCRGEYELPPRHLTF